MIGAVDAFPYAHRPDQDGTWTVFDTRSGVTAARGFLPVMGLSETDAEGVAAILNRNTVGPASRLHRYAIQALPGKR
ncbi:hypothetical protein J2Y48_005034 [Mycoplana sp. BE70]|uniref:hypothetical protein n=1 Tax=Mycoplana sp. BE70 TaxID=2817775 RepID=UPI00285A30A8|nr:hypothetical protein [Mycoplana sp. BE70]MDR6759716.1 hypothetical protein [Mycoplana sp. BE70]